MGSYLGVGDLCSAAAGGHGKLLSHLRGLPSAARWLLLQHQLPAVDRRGVPNAQLVESLAQTLDR